jgi:hypothetical protein
MQSKTDEFLATLEIRDIEERYPRSFELYEEYSQRSIAETIRTLRESFEKANLETVRRIIREAEEEIAGFCAWLKETKNFEHIIAHYYSSSLKCMLVGLPVGVQVAQLFDAVLEKQIGK